MRVDDLRMKLKAPNPPVLVCCCSYYVARPGECSESGREMLYAVAMTHPSLKLRGQPGKKRVGFQDIDRGLAELAAIPAGHNLAAKTMGNELKAIADSQCGNPRIEEFRGK